MAARKSADRLMGLLPAPRGHSRVRQGWLRRQRRVSEWKGGCVGVGCTLYSSPIRPFRAPAPLRGGKLRAAAGGVPNVRAPTASPCFSATYESSTIALSTWSK